MKSQYFLCFIFIKNNFLLIVSLLNYETLKSFNDPVKIKLRIKILYKFSESKNYAIKDTFTGFRITSRGT